MSTHTIQQDEDAATDNKGVVPTHHHNTHHHNISFDEHDTQHTAVAAQHDHQSKARQRAQLKKQFMKKTKKGQPLMKARIDKVLAALEAGK